MDSVCSEFQGKLNILIRLFILPNLEPYLLLLEPEMQPEKQRNETKRQEAWQVYGALLCAVGQCMHERAKIFSNLLSPPTRASSRPNGKAMIAISRVVPKNFCKR
ncbi:transcription initiation factor TFIID subunit 6b isoform X3 [Arachis hypogaea]|uniref:transcription initiation factor TFIID subunit 6b isoform X3 n=1 Tax=Arachis hypogaea TaxID=3818 RepID=UPI0007AF6E67|nr:transcription initiation factor TFIID subunit 6b isoform X8 [Arachis hypogaea]QHN92666.1 Transcription initiation factor TFIID subunit [Arachis hypogaea]